MLTGVACTADAALDQLHSHADRAGHLLAQLRQDTGDALNAVRRIVQGLRPPALDEVGLTAALRQHALRCGEGVHVEVGGSLVDDVPRATSGSGRGRRLPHRSRRPHRSRPPCRTQRPFIRPRVIVTLDLSSDELVLTVHDDGAPTTDWAAGTGLTSISSRCDEIGGSVVAGPTADGGLVAARLPLTAGGHSSWREGAPTR